MTTKAILDYVKKYSDPKWFAGGAKIRMYSAGIPNSTRSVVISRSPYWKPYRHNYTVAYYHEDTLLGCENGLGTQAMIKAVKAWEYRQGWI